MDPGDQELCTESVWARFAETALKFPRLQHVELFREKDLGGTLPGLASLGITDAAFKQLITARKFVCRYVDWGSWDLQIQKNTINIKTRGKPADKTTDNGRGRGASGTRTSKEAGFLRAGGLREYPYSPFGAVNINESQ